MNINRINSMRMNPYQKQQEFQESLKAEKKKDEVKISSEAKELQKESSIQTERDEKIKAIKEKVQSGDYEVHPHKIAQKMYDFWTE
ncbi:flagellar biosynthesis anti-sigma factor FlgM [Bacillus solimangrovi]|uniref:Negative regulator of flagellin synthesis n=1 Tax=Bacillus solimangrovi TaxID=1305675 RepID=A0A1E5LDP0_9BACI|nr:flagellar biosynthesis anti-sigma factor FlgM [Bacillus solimangrovi]OEH92197.1 flagellar biosynthesis anti-sigma factor FlgM [Bacillus solimangrovi]